MRVPITMAYNHHHDTAVVGCTHLEVSRDAAMASSPLRYPPLAHRAWTTSSSAGADVPTSAMFSDGNGGSTASRTTYAPRTSSRPGHRPRRLADADRHVEPRGDVDPGAPHFVAARSPPTRSRPPASTRAARCRCHADLQVADAGSESFSTTNAAIFVCVRRRRNCAASVATAACFAAAAAAPRLANVTMATATVSDDTAPPGCSIALTSGRAVATYNSNDKSPASRRRRQADRGGGAAGLGAARPRRDDGDDHGGGADGKWFGAGFGAAGVRPRVQAVGAWAVIVDGHGAATERQMGDHAAGFVATSVTVKSNAVVGGARTVVVTRRWRGRRRRTSAFAPPPSPSTSSLPRKTTIAFPVQAATLQMWPAASGDRCVCSRPPAPFGGSARSSTTRRACPASPTPPTRWASPALRRRRGPSSSTGATRRATSAHTKAGWPPATTPGVGTRSGCAVGRPTARVLQEVRITRSTTRVHKQITRQDWGIAADGDTPSTTCRRARRTPASLCVQDHGRVAPVAANAPKKTRMVAAHLPATRLLPQDWAVQRRGGRALHGQRRPAAPRDRPPSMRERASSRRLPQGRAQDERRRRR